LKQAVSFSSGQLIELLDKNGLSHNALDPFIRPFGEVRIDEFSFGGDGPEPLLITPVITDGDTFVVAIPEALLVAVKHYVVSMAVRCGETQALASSYLDAVFHSVLGSVRRNGGARVKVELRESLGIPGCREALFEIDHDKLMYVLLLVDTLDEYDVGNTSGMWNTPDLAARIVARFREVESEIYSKWPSINELMCLLVNEGVGRTHFLAFEEEPTMVSEFLHLNAHDLETISFLEGSNHLTLWRFARKSNTVRKTAKVMAWSTLDEFGLYRKNRCSYYLSDEKPYNLISIMPDYSAPLRVEVLKTHDRHTVPHHIQKNYVEVSTIHSTNKIPLYEPLRQPNKRVECFVEGYVIPLWVIGAVPTGGTLVHRLCFEFCAAIGYWLWQLFPALGTVIADARKTLNSLTIKVLPHMVSNSSASNSGGDQKDAPITILAEPGSNEVLVELKPDTLRMFGTADNEGERVLIRNVLEAIAQLSDELTRTLSEAAITKMVDKYCPRSAKKMLLMIDVIRNPRLDPRSIPSFRPIQSGELDDVLDVVGEHLTKVRAMPVGPIAKDKRNDTLHDCVGVLYGRLQTLLATLNPEKLLEWLVVQHEAVVREDALQQLTITTRLACFGPDSEVITQLQKRIPVIAQTAIASRFLIEYVVARPPSGLREISDGLNDELRALATEIVTFGMDSDLVQYDLADVGLSILESGRLGNVNNQYREAQEAHSQDYTSTQIAISSRRFGRYWREGTHSGSNISDLQNRLDIACKAEFHFTMTELMEFMGELITVGHKIDPGVVVAPLKFVVEEISEARKWDSGKTQQILEFFALRERADFLQPPAGFKREHIYPWRFGRPLSYIRRPLLLRAKGVEAEVIWGNRHVEASRINFFSIVMGGKFHPQSAEMKSLMGEMRNRDGMEFNNRVAEFFKQRPRMNVKARVQSLGKLSLANLGDIDVVAADMGRRILYLVECKDLSMARTPYELATEIREFIVGSACEKSAIEKHKARVDFVHQHLSTAIEWLGGDLRSAWKVSPIVVVDEPLMSPHIKTCTLPVVPIDLLGKYLK
jgi:hypothetical protein